MSHAQAQITLAKLRRPESLEYPTHHIGTDYHRRTVLTHSTPLLHQDLRPGLWRGGLNKAARFVREATRRRERARRKRMHVLASRSGSTRTRPPRCRGSSTRYSTSSTSPTCRGAAPRARACGPSPRARPTTRPRGRRATRTRTRTAVVSAVGFCPPQAAQQHLLASLPDTPTALPSGRMSCAGRRGETSSGVRRQFYRRSRGSSIGGRRRYSLRRGRRLRGAGVRWNGRLRDPCGLQLLPALATLGATLRPLRRVRGEQELLVGADLHAQTRGGRKRPILLLGLRAWRSTV